MPSSAPNFQSILRSNGFKATPIRSRLLHILWASKRPLTVDEIGRRLDLNVVTVYRALNDFLQKGLVMRGIGAAGIEGDLRGDIRAAHFLYPRNSHHHHMICSDCGFAQLCRTC